MSVGTNNPFAILGDDEPLVDPKTEDPAPVPATQPAARNTQKQRGGGPAARGGKYYARGGKTQAPKETTSAAEEPVPESQRKSDGAREGGRDGERGRGRARGRARAGGPGRGRPFDRHSQTGKTDSEKKIHQSWGGGDGNTEFKTEEAATFDAAAEVTNNEWGSSTNDWGASTSNDWGTATIAVDDWNPPAESTVESNADPWASDPTPAEGDAKPEQGRGRKDKEPEEEDHTLTFDQYLAQQKEKESAIPKLEAIRKANDGADDIWKNAVPLSKNDDDESYYVGKTKNAPKARTKKEEKVYIEIDARFERPDRGRGRGRSDRGRGDRERGHGGGRGRGGKSGRHDTNGSTPAVNVDDQIAFPSLT